MPMVKLSKGHSGTSSMSLRFATRSAICPCDMSGEPLCRRVSDSRILSRVHFSSSSLIS
ncbi:hypothetical protein [Methanococcoides sp. NM1]|uniref:hypothetical protein n=1 Tax=Methanococcoides sp. NM1 TaxID=1201013 RepID=UPI0014386A86|nr:hypothetical protein [Methanococcoides sp. NM1]